MKSSRHNAILEIIENNNVETQEDLARYLLERGHKVTQATISRDIKELHLIKVQAENNVYKYAVNETNKLLNTEKLLRVFKETVISIQHNGDLVVINTLNGSANAAAEVIDNMQMDDIIGTLAGDNTIFIAVKEGMAKEVASILKNAVAK